MRPSWNVLMPRFRALLPSSASRRAAIVALAGVSISLAGGDIGRSPSGGAPRIAIGAFPKAMAGDDDDSRRRGSNGAASGKKDSDDDRNPRTGGRRDKTMQGESQTSQNALALGYDAARKMMSWRFKLGQERREGVHASHPRQYEHTSLSARLGERETGSIGEAILRNIQGDGQHPHEFQALNTAINPVAARYREGTKTFASTTIIPKTQFAIGEVSFSPNEVLAVGLDPEAIQRVKAMGFQADAPLGADEVVRLVVPQGWNSLYGKEMLSHALPGHQFEFNKIYRIYHASMRDEIGPSVKNPPPEERCAGDRCFARNAIGWNDALGACARGVKIGVIDTGFDAAHPAFAGRANIHSYRFIPDGRPAAPDWHGTGVLSLLAGNPLSGTPGLIPEAEFHAANVFFSDEGGEMAADTISVLKALQKLGEEGVKIINMSFAGPRDELVAQEIDRMHDAGVIFVAAAGNDGPTADPRYPAAYPQVIAVTAVTKELKNYRYANRGAHIDVAAPGVDIWAAVPGAREGYHTGTSFAAPHVTAVLAVEARDALKNEVSQSEDPLYDKNDKNAILAASRVQDLGELGRDPIYGRGLLLAPETCTTSSPNIVASAE